MAVEKETRYFNFHYRLLRFIGLGLFRDPELKNYQNFSNPLYVCYSIVQLGFWVFLFTIALWMQVPYIYKDLDRLMLNLSFSVTFTFSFIKLYIVLFKNTAIQEIVHAIENEMCEFYQNKKILRWTVQMSKKLTISVLCFANLTVVGLIVGGAAQAYWSPHIYTSKTNSTAFKPSDRILPMPVYLPFEITSDLVFSVAFVYQILGIQWYGNLVVLINTFMNTIMVHFSGRFANLRYVIENLKYVAIIRLQMQKLDSKENDVLKFEEIMENLIHDEVESDDGQIKHALLDKETKFSEEKLNNQMYVCLKECIQHHILIITYVEKFEEVYNIAFLSHVINNLNVICHVMLQISENEIFSIRCGTAIALFFTVVSELLVQCYAGNELTLQATGIADSAYNCQWYTTDKKFKRLLMILIMRAQKRVEVTAGKFAAISNSTFVAIMRGAYSFFAVIRSTSGD